ncbi:hypothetical protein RAA17_24730 [Komagataeibacter rhaeticus]|nr:hypothetical protein [Komagataeibacter rhaeticus]
MEGEGKIASFGVATSETWTDRASGERRENPVAPCRLFQRSPFSRDRTSVPEGNAGLCRRPSRDTQVDRPAGTGPLCDRDHH